MSSLEQTVSRPVLVHVSGWLLCVVVLAFAGPALLTMPSRGLRRRAATVPDPECWPAVTVVIAARDEQARIGQTLQRLLASDYPSLQIVLANDRSSDDTGAIAASVAEHDPRLTVVTITQVPDGWLGKTHAMARAVELATGEFILFTDGDILFEPDTLRMSLRYVLARKLDHFCLFPSMETTTWLERVLVAFFAMLFTFGTQPWLRARFFSRSYYGIGAFNLVRRTAYDAAGGHAAIKLDVLDDVKLGKLLLHHRAIADCLIAGTAVRVRWQDSTWGVIRGLEKNAFASMNYSVLHLVGFTLFFSSVFFVPWVMVAAWPLAESVGFAATLVLLHVCFAVLSWTFGGGWLTTPGLTLGAMGLLLAFWRSAAVTIRRGGVRWRDTFYPLSDLKRGLYH